MRNCFFEDSSFTTTVKPLSLIKDDGYGYFIEVRIKKTDIAKFIENGVVPFYVQDNDIFAVRIALNNNTTVRINGMRLTSLSDGRLEKIPISAISIRELALKLYSKKSGKKHFQCYATKVLFKININQTRKLQ